MAQIIDFKVEKALRKSGIKDKALIEDIINEGYDPVDPIELENYYQWKTFQSVVFTDVEHNWTDEALQRLYTDIKLCDPTQVYTIDTNTGYIDFDNIDLNLDDK